jgi:hypothetical protein
LDLASTLEAMAARRGTTDVEGTHGQLRAGLADLGAITPTASPVLTRPPRPRSRP